jgi:hypothetical protein
MNDQIYFPGRQPANPDCAAFAPSYRATRNDQTFRGRAAGYREGSGDPGSRGWRRGRRFSLNRVDHSIGCIQLAENILESRIQLETSSFFFHPQFNTILRFLLCLDLLQQENNIAEAQFAGWIVRTSWLRGWTASPRGLTTSLRQQHLREQTEQDNDNQAMESKPHII